VLLDGDGAEIDVDDAQDALQAVATLGAGGVIDHVRRDEVIHCALVTGLLPSKKLVDDVLCAAPVH
jgi:hypothetical protein